MTTRLLLPILVLLSVLLPRLMLLGGYPAMDDGFYTYSAMLAHRSLSAGEGLPYHGMLLLYPTLLSWVFALDYNPFFFLRFVDMLVAAISALLLYRLLAQESGSRIAGALLAAAFMFILNTYPFIQSGFRNSQFVAYIPLLLAISLALHKPALTTRDWLLCGALIALCVLLRENFAPFAVYGTLCIFFWRGFRPASAFVLGGAVTGIVVIGLMLLLRGGGEGLVNSYVEMSAMNDSQFQKNLARFFRNFDIAKGIAMPALVVTLLAASLPLLTRQCHFYRGHLWRILFWSGLALVPLIEPFFKKGVIYHYSVCLIGLAGLCALFARLLPLLPHVHLRLASVSLMTIFLFMSADRFSELHQQFTKRTLPNLTETAGKGWSAEAHKQNRYLQMADAVEREMPENGTLSIGGTLYVIYALTGITPPSDFLKDITFALTSTDAETLTDALRNCPPDIILLSRHDYKKRGAAAIVESLPDYQKQERFEQDNSIDYGVQSGTLYKRITPSSPCR